MEGPTPVSLHMKDTETPAGKTHPSPLYRKPHTNDRKMSKSDKRYLDQLYKKTAYTERIMSKSDKR